jgi:hypothetical protein
VAPGQKQCKKIGIFVKQICFAFDNLKRKKFHRKNCICCNIVK